MLTYEAQEHVIAAFQHLLKAVGASKDLTDDARRVLLEFDTHMSAMNVISERIGGGFTDLEGRLKHAEEKVLSWEAKPSLIWDSGPSEVNGYLQSVQEIQSLNEALEGVLMVKNGKHNELASRAKHSLQVAMSRLQEELYHILSQNKQHFEPQFVYLHTRADSVVYDESFVSSEDNDIVEEASQGENSIRELDLVDPGAIPDIKSIANAMFASQYDKEFCEAFIGIRRDALEEYLDILDIQKLSIEDVLKLDWDSLNSLIKKWMWAMRIIVRVYLASEKRLCDQIFSDVGLLNSSCFVEISKASIFCLLNLGEAIAMGPRKPEKLIRLLDMYEVVAELHLDIDALFVEEVGSLIRIEFHELLKQVAESARGTFFKFRDAITSDVSVHPFPGGGIHHLTRYVMNYIKVLTGYCDTLNLLLKDQDVDDPFAVVEMRDREGVPSSTLCPLACHLRAIAATLESNLVSKSQLYVNHSLGHIFLLNNIHYMVQKVKSSELRLYFGDEWIRKHNAKVQQYATSYVRASWSPILACLRDDKTSLKERCRRLSIAFEDVYKCETRWCIPDLDLRADMQISTSQKVIPAYRSFLAALENANVSDKHVKYASDDLEKMLLDLFVGSAKSLRSYSRKW